MTWAEVDIGYSLDYMTVSCPNFECDKVVIFVDGLGKAHAEEDFVWLVAFTVKKEFLHGYGSKFEIYLFPLLRFLVKFSINLDVILFTYKASTIT